MPTRPNLHARSVLTARRLALGLALLAPASAIAAPTAARAPAEDRPTQREAAPEVALERDLEAVPPAGPSSAAYVKPEPPGPFHPVDGTVSYGEADAAFGNSRGRPHEGQDIFAPAGTPVIAPSRGEVLETGSDGGRGNWAALYDPRRDQTYVYFHLLGPAEVGAGEKVAPGEKVGEIGCTGSCYGDHLHFEIRPGADPYSAPEDPMPKLAEWKRFRG